MIPFKRPLSLVLMCSLLMLGAGYPVRADEPVTDTSTSTQTSEVSSVSASAQTQSDVTDQSSTATTASSSSETDTSVHETSNGGYGTTTNETVTASTPLVFPVNLLATTSSVTDGSSTTAPFVSSSTPILSPDGTTTIVTGNATAGANLVNAAGSNFVNSSGEIVLSNYFNPVSGIDLRTAPSAFSTGGVCLLFSCTGSDGVSVTLTGTSSLANSLSLTAQTGGNAIVASGTAAILTGDALVGLNLVNLANVNVVDSRYFIAALNLFKGLNGDLVFPGLTGFTDALVGGGANTVTLNSNAVADTRIAFTGGTGDNHTTASSSRITTGTALTMSTLLNQLNLNDLGGADLSIRVRIRGIWAGSIFSAPDGFTVSQDGDGITLTHQGGNPLAIGTASVTASTSALIMNTAVLDARTGGNSIEGADTAAITTGNAFGAANVLNLANQNIIGKNWLTAIVNIFGDFTGNIAFGRPDIFVGERVEAPTPLTDGSEVTLHFTVTNRGDAAATRAVFSASLDRDHLELLDATSTSANLSTLLPGASTELVYRARVHAGPGTAIETSGTASAYETDNNVSNNTDQVTLHTAASLGGSSGGRSTSARILKPLDVARHTTNTVLSSRVRSVHEEVSVLNPNEATSSPVDLHDLLKSPSGVVIHDEAWPLNTLAPHEEVIVAYDIVFDQDAPSGTYGLSTVLASDIAGDTEYPNNGSIVLIGTSAVSREALHRGRVLGIATTTEPTITRSVPELPESNSLAAAVENAHIPWQYALLFVMASALFLGLWWGLVRLRRVGN